MGLMIATALPCSRSFPTSPLKPGLEWATLQHATMVFDNIAELCKSGVRARDPVEKAVEEVDHAEQAVGARRPCDYTQNVFGWERGTGGFNVAIKAWLRAGS